MEFYWNSKPAELSSVHRNTFRYNVTAFVCNTPGRTTNNLVEFAPSIRVPDCSRLFPIVPPFLGRSSRATRIPSDETNENEKTKGKSTRQASRTASSVFYRQSELGSVQLLVNHAPIERYQLGYNIVLYGFHVSVGLKLQPQ